MNSTTANECTGSVPEWACLQTDTGGGGAQVALTAELSATDRLREKRAISFTCILNWWLHQVLVDNET